MITTTIIAVPDLTTLGSSTEAGGAELGIGGAHAPTKRYKVTLMLETHTMAGFLTEKGFIH